MKKILQAIFFFSLIIAQDWGGQSGGFLRMGMTARSLAMGGGFTAELDQSFSTFHNPAWAAFLVDRHLGSSYTNLTMDRRLAATSFAMPIPPTAGIGVAWVFAGVNNIQGRYSTGMRSSEMQTGENALMITFAQRVVPWISVGANFKLLKYDLPVTESDQLSGSGIGFDIGILIKTGKYNILGIMIQDLSSNYQWDTNEVFTQGGPYKDEFPTIFKIGSRFNNKGLVIVGDIGVITDHENYTGLLPRIGIEYGFLDQYLFRGGYGNGRMAFGAGYEYGLFKTGDSHIDYAFSMDWVSQTAHTISYAFNF
tara:strand:+ start:2849 stop:3775 length:927 start_codon:yes stop_codon:yes gene_type:complete